MIAALVRRIIRLQLLVVMLFSGLAILYLVFPRLDARERERYVATWSKLLMACCGARVRQSIAPGAEPLERKMGGRLLVLNHVSWLDIFAIDSLVPASFVAKAEIAQWPLAGQLVARTGTVFIERGKRHAVHAVIRQLATKMEEGRRAAVFPEGTTTEGSRLLPFHGNLIEAALEAKVPVLPIGIRYLDLDGRPSEAVNYVGEVTFLASLWRIAGHPGLQVELHVLPEIDVESGGLTRQAIARQAREAIAARLNLEMDDTVPENLRRTRQAAAG